MASLDMILDGALASVVAVFFSNPFDTMRTRMQLQGERCRAGQYAVVYRGLLQGMWRVRREEGARALQKGLAPAMLWQITQNGVRIGLYPALKADLGWLLGRPDSLASCVGAGAVCGFLGAALSSPFMMVKTRLQAQRAASPAPSDGVWDALRRVYRQHGLRGLWHGASVAALTAVLASMVQLTTYDRLKAAVAGRAGWPSADLRVHALASVGSTAILMACLNPLLLVSTRVYNAPFHADQRPLRRLGQTLAETYRIEGVQGLYKGSTAFAVRSVPHFLLTFMALEQLRGLRERYGVRPYTTGTNANANIGYFQRRYGAKRLEGVA